MKKRRAVTAGLEEADRTLHASFCAAANSISHLYTQAHTQNKLAFQAGQRHSLEKLCEWMQKHHQQFGTLPTALDVYNFSKNELDNISQSEMMVSQAQNAPLPSQHSLVPPFACERAELPTEQARFSHLYPLGMPPG